MREKINLSIATGPQKQRKLSKMKWEKSQPLNYCKWTAKTKKTKQNEMRKKATSPLQLDRKRWQKSGSPSQSVSSTSHKPSHWICCWANWWSGFKSSGWHIEISWVDCWQQLLARANRLMGTSADDVWSFMNSWCLTTNPFHCLQGVSGFRLRGGTNCLSCRNSVQYFAFFHNLSPGSP